MRVVKNYQPNQEAFPKIIDMRSFTLLFCNMIQANPSVLSMKNKLFNNFFNSLIIQDGLILQIL